MMLLGMGGFEFFYFHEWAFICFCESLVIQAQNKSSFGGLCKPL